MMRKFAGVALLCFGMLQMPAQAAPTPDGPPVAMAVGVAPFVDRAGKVQKSLGQGLAQELVARGGVRVVFPKDLDGLGVDDPDAREVRRWAERRELDVIVLGVQSLRAGKAKVAVEVRSGHSGALVERYEVAAEDEGEANQQVAELAPRILKDLGVTKADSSGSPRQDKKGDSPGTTFEIGKKGKPVAIESDELEVTQEAGARHIVFTGNVRVKQGTVTLVADRLDAFYAKGSSRPEYLEATGSVRVRDGNKRARCENAIYHNTDRKVFCKGKAELFQGCDRVRGSEIEFDLEKERVRVLGAASVVLQSDEKSSKCDGGFQ